MALAIRIEQLALIITSALCTCARAVLFTFNTLIFGLPNAVQRDVYNVAAYSIQCNINYMYFTYG